MPTPQDPWYLRKVAHLHVRAGFGATWTELLRDREAGPDASIVRLLQSRQFTTDEAIRQVAFFDRSRSAGSIALPAGPTHSARN
jgi:hypothetical protein